MAVRALTALVFAAYAAALAWQAGAVGVTFDEPAHLVSSLQYWRGNDFLQPVDTPPLTKLVAGWVPLALGVEPRTDTDAWRTGWQWDIGVQTLEKLGPEQARRTIFLSRLAMLVFPLALLATVWAWSRELWGERAALAAAAALALEPNLLAHGPLIKSDVAAAAGLLATCYLGWRYWLVPSRGRFAAFAAVASLAAMAKFTLLLAPAAALAVVALRRPPGAGWRVPLGRAAALALAAYFTAAALYRFDLIQVRGRQFAALADAHDWPEAERRRWRRMPKIPLPRRLIEGVGFIGSHDRERGFPGYFWGRATAGGERWYFPATLALKMPIPLQALLAAGLAALAWRLARRRIEAADVALWAPALALFALAVESRINIGYRHVMPLTPPLLLGAAHALLGIGPRGRRTAAAAGAAGAAWLATASVSIYPHGIAYFNEWAGGPDNGWRYLADSNLDWGQDLPALARLLEERGVERVRLAYFGQDLLWHYFPGERIDVVPTPFCGGCALGEVYVPEPGVYAVSANMLLGYFWEPRQRDYLRYFREREPDAKAGYSIFVYDLR